MFRYKDEIFFTWNGTKDQLATFLQTIKNKHAHIDVETSFAQRLVYFNTQIENRHGQLYTSVFHPSDASKYTLPYVLGHTKLNHQLWFRSTLMRAIRLCSNYLDFQMEQTYLIVACLLHGYSKELVDTQLKHFYLRFNAEKICHGLDTHVYDRLRRRLFDFIAVQRAQLFKQQQLEDEEFLFHFSYPYDYGAYHNFHDHFLTLWTKYFHVDAQLGHEDTTISLSCKPVYSLNALLAKEKSATHSMPPRDH